VLKSYGVEEGTMTSVSAEEDDMSWTCCSVLVMVA